MDQETGHKQLDVTAILMSSGERERERETEMLAESGGSA